MAICLGVMCPICRDPKGTVRRLQRAKWMRSIPGTKHYGCSHCGGRFIAFFDLVSLMLGRSSR